MKMHLFLSGGKSESEKASVLMLVFLLNFTVKLQFQQDEKSIQSSKFLRVSRWNMTINLMKFFGLGLLNVTKKANFYYILQTSSPEKSDKAANNSVAGMNKT